MHRNRHPCGRPGSGAQPGGGGPSPVRRDEARISFLVTPTPTSTVRVADRRRRRASLRLTPHPPGGTGMRSNGMPASSSWRRYLRANLQAAIVCRGVHVARAASRWPKVASNFEKSDTVDVVRVVAVGGQVPKGTPKQRRVVGCADDVVGHDGFFRARSRGAHVRTPGFRRMP